MYDNEDIAANPEDAAFQDNFERFKKAAEEARANKTSTTTSSENPNTIRSKVERNLEIILDPRKAKQLVKNQARANYWGIKYDPNKTDEENDAAIEAFKPSKGQIAKKIGLGALQYLFSGGTRFDTPGTAETDAKADLDKWLKTAMPQGAHAAQLAEKALQNAAENQLSNEKLAQNKTLADEKLAASEKRQQNYIRMRQDLQNEALAAKDAISKEAIAAKYKAIEEAGNFEAQTSRKYLRALTSGDKTDAEFYGKILNDLQAQKNAPTTRSSTTVGTMTDADGNIVTFTKPSTSTSQKIAPPLQLPSEIPTPSQSPIRPIAPSTNTQLQPPDLQRSFAPITPKQNVSPIVNQIPAPAPSYATEVTQQPGTGRQLGVLTPGMNLGQRYDKEHQKSIAQTNTILTDHDLLRKFAVGAAFEPNKYGKSGLEDLFSTSRLFKSGAINSTAQALMHESEKGKIEALQGLLRENLPFMDNLSQTQRDFLTQLQKVGLGELYKSSGKVFTEKEYNTVMSRYAAAFTAPSAVLHNILTRSLVKSAVDILETARPAVLDASRDLLTPAANAAKKVLESQKEYFECRKDKTKTQSQCAIYKPSASELNPAVIFKDIFSKAGVKVQ